MSIQVINKKLWKTIAAILVADNVPSLGGKRRKRRFLKIIKMKKIRYAQNDLKLLYICVFMHLSYCPA